MFQTYSKNSSFTRVSTECFLESVQVQYLKSIIVNYSVPESKWIITVISNTSNVYCSSATWTYEPHGSFLRKAESKGAKLELVM